MDTADHKMLLSTHIRPTDRTALNRAVTVREGAQPEKLPTLPAGRATHPLVSETQPGRDREGAVAWSINTVCLQHVVDQFEEAEQKAPLPCVRGSVGFRTLAGGY
jgi:hypothetical protein